MQRTIQDLIPCRHLASWDENQAPLGSRMYWPEHFEECQHPTIYDMVPEDEDPQCSSQCPGYEPMEIEVCPKHGEFLVEEGCYKCMER